MPRSRHRLPARAARRAAAALLAALVIAGCDDGRRTVEGIEPMVQEQRRLRHVDTVEVAATDGLNVRVIVAAPRGELAEGGHGRDAIVWIVGAADLLDFVETTVDGARLRVAIAEDVRLSPVPDVEVRVAGLTRLVASGAGVVRLEVEAGHVAEALSIEAEGSVLVEGTGAARSIDVEATGSGDVHLLSLEADEAVYERTGSGDGWLRVRRHVRAELTGSGDLHIGGDPSTAVETTGSGRVKMVDR